LLPKEAQGIPLKKEDEFCPAETNYKETKRIMICKKFEALYQDRLTRRESNG